MPQTAHGAQPEKERPVNVLVAPVDQRVEKGQVKGELAHQRKGQHPPGVLPEAVGVQEALHQQEAVEGERQPPGPPQADIQREQRLGNGPRAGKDASFQAGRAEMVQQHTAKGQPLEGRTAERGALCLGNNHKQPSKRVWIRLSVAGKSLFFVEISAWVLDKGRAG